MFPKRFVESGCLKCHHDVVDLEPSDKYPDPPAPKLIAGYETIRRYGCFGCHEINGFAGADKRIGPDLRLEPNYYAAAEQLKTDPGLAKLDKQAPKWADDVEQRDDAYARRRLYELVAPMREGQSRAVRQEAPKPVLRADSHRLEAVLKDVDLPGTQRKVGPSLRHVGSKLSYDFLGELDRQSAKLPPRHADAAVLRSVGSFGRRRPGRIAAAGADRNSRPGGISAEGQPAVRICRAAEGREAG